MGRRSGRDDYGAHFPPSRPRAAKGGVRARSQRGAFASQWWGRRWIAALEGMGIGARLSRGRSYARAGQVLSVEIEPGGVRAMVQGSRPQPYRVEILLRPLPPQAWDQVARALRGHAAHMARLAAGELPPEVEDVFAQAGLPLFPTRVSDLETSCSCPDWSNPCKHIAAVHYLIGEEFDRDPFLLLRLRGLEREALSALLADASLVETPGQEAIPPEPLPADPRAFWGGAWRGTSDPSTVPAEEDPAALVRRLGNLPFWRGSIDLAAALAPAYALAAQRATDLLASGLEGAAAVGEDGGGDGAAMGDEDPAGAGAVHGVEAAPPARPPGRSRDRVALAADLAAGVALEALRQRYDGRTLRAVLRRAGAG